MQAVKRSTALAVISALSALLMILFLTPSASACGGLVADKQSVSLAKTNILVDWHDGIERYMTNFTYRGDVKNLGWIVPLPTEPMKIEEGGEKAFDLLYEEAHPTPTKFSLWGNDGATAGAPQVLQQVKINSLNVTVIKGRGDEIIEWVQQNGFVLDDHSKAHLNGYAQGNSIFLTAKYDVAEAQKQQEGKPFSTPVLVTMKTKYPWVPIEIYAFHKQYLELDIYLLTDKPVYTNDVSAAFGKSSVDSELTNAPGFKINYQEQISSKLHTRLTQQKNMSWVREASWLTHLNLYAPDTQIWYDLGVSSTNVLRLATYGTQPNQVVERYNAQEFPSWLQLPRGTPQIAFIALIIALLVGTTIFLFRKRLWKHRTKRLSV